MPHLIVWVSGDDKRKTCHTSWSATIPDVMRQAKKDSCEDSCPLWIGWAYFLEHDTSDHVIRDKLKGLVMSLESRYEDTTANRGAIYKLKKVVYRLRNGPGVQHVPGDPIQGYGFVYARLRTHTSDDSTEAVALLYAGAGENGGVN